MSEKKVDTSRRAALVKLGLFGLAAAGAYAVPTLVGISKARAGSARDHASRHAAPPPRPASEHGSES